MLTKTFKQLSKNDVVIAGGKGASLGEMTQAGIPVPPGFVVLSTTFDQFIKDADLIQEIDAILEKVNHKEIHTVENASEQIQGLIKSVTMSESIAEEIERQFKNLDTEYVAVRSSATAEDGAEHAWAGQLDSFLNTTEKDLLEKVQHCWASLFTPRAIFYRFEKGLHATQISVAVVVQKMVNSEVSGIAFSVHPVTEDRNQLIIEAGFGLGEAIVSGQITPDSYVAEKEPRRIIDVNVNTQTRALYRVQGGGNEWRDIPEPQASSQVLNEAQILELSKIIIGIENHYGFPCDIEWAYENGNFYIVQSRPITTLSKQTSSQTIFEKFKEATKGIEITKQEGNFSLLHYVGCLGGCFPPYSSKYYNFDFGSMVFLGEGKHGLLLFNLNKYTLTTKTTFDKFIKQKGIIDEIKDFNSIWEETNRIYKKYSPDKIISLDKKELDLLIKKLFKLYHQLLSSTVFSESLDENQVREYYKEITGGLAGFDDFFLFGSKPIFESFVLRMDQSLADKEKTTDDLQYLFSDYYITPPVDAVREKVKELMLQRGGLEKIQEEIKNIKHDISENNIIVNEYEAKLSGDKSLLFDFVQKSMYIRDIRKEPLQKQLALISNTVRAIFEKNGLNPVDAPYAVYNDFNSGFYKSNLYHAEINNRKDQGFIAMFNAKETTFEYGDISEKKKKFFKLMDKDTKNDFEIIGNIAYKGIVRAEAQVVLSEKDFPKFKDGNVLVTSMTRPEFVSLMKRASAVITDEGGITCHAAIVSRELKIPCIIGTKKATRVLKDGDVVEVDAEKGIIKIIK